MSDEMTTTTEQVQGAHVAPITEEAPLTVRPETTDHQAPKQSASERLRRRKAKNEVISISPDEDDADAEPIKLIVKGIDANLMFDAVDELQIDDLPLKQQTAELARLVVHDAETDELLFEDWSNDEILALPIDAFQTLATAVAKVTGRDGSAGKD